MAKRFIDTSLFRKGFVRGLEAPYKLLWLYILSECDHAGLWDVEIEIAELRLGVKFGKDPLSVFSEKVVSIDGGSKWFIPSFIEFQYGDLNPENRAHNSVISLLRKHSLLTEENEIKPLISPLQGSKDMDKDKELDKEKEKEPKIKKFNAADHLPEEWDLELFQPLWSEFQEVRRRKNRPLTDNAKKRALNKLVKLSGGKWYVAEPIMTRTIDKAYDEFFPLKDEPKRELTMSDPEYYNDKP